MKSKIYREPMPIFFLGVDFIVFPVVFFSNFKPHLHPLHKGSAVFLSIELTQTYIAIVVPPHGNHTKAPIGRQGNAK